MRAAARLPAPAAPAAAAAPRTALDRVEAVVGIALELGELLLEHGQPVVVLLGLVGELLDLLLERADPAGEIGERRCRRASRHRRAAAAGGAICGSK